MKRILVLFLLSFSICAQRPAPDTLELGKSRLIIQPVFHGALVLQWQNKTIYVDPYGGKKALEGLPAPDLILITDIHPDHLDTATLALIDVSKTTLVVPSAVLQMLPEKYKKKVVMMGNGETKSIEGILIEAMPMYNLPETPDSRHVKGRGNGYVLTVDGKRIYVSGDTEDIAEMRSLKNIEVAFICMNLPFTMDINQASEGVLAFKPRIVYPYHYRGKDGMSDTRAFSELVKKGNTKIEVRLRNWYGTQP